MTEFYIIYSHSSHTQSSSLAWIVAQQVGEAGGFNGVDLKKERGNKVNFSVL